ncbi:hypothetical protein NDU88_003850 [Pleurodeles waltl]|uniref:Uncharacterized protein n=1 Tax=Pleurodeles waltl TaxID=8319 RepID=A0AAV7VI29_PLEWA|nr:hypothetical protein NDU88_003850 [Pleurodeles waltl]
MKIIVRLAQEHPELLTPVPHPDPQPTQWTLPPLFRPAVFPLYDWSRHLTCQSQLLPVTSNLGFPLQRPEERHLQLPLSSPEPPYPTSPAIATPPPDDRMSVISHLRSPLNVLDTEAYIECSWLEALP